MLAFVLIGLISCVDYSTVFEGNWNISVSSIDSDGVENTDETKYYTTQILKAETPRTVIGDLIGEDEDGLAVTLNQIKIEPSEENNNTFNFMIMEVDSEEPTEKIHFEIKEGADGIAMAITKNEEGKTTYILRVLSPTEAQISIVDNENNMKVIRLLKEIQENKPSFISQMLFPMMMMLMMTFMKGNGARPQQGQQQQQQQPQGNSK